MASKAEDADRELIEQLRLVAGETMVKTLLNVGPDTLELRELLRNGKLEEALTTFVRETIRRNTYFREETAPGTEYPAGYNPRPTLAENLHDVENELRGLRRHFPELADANWNQDFHRKIRFGELVLPHGAERWVCVPRESALGPSYREAVLRTFNTLAAVHGMHRLDGEFRDWHLSPDSGFRRHRAVASVFEGMERGQPHSQVLLLPMQYGMRHAGRSARRAVETMGHREFPIGCLEVGSLMLLHPEWWLESQNFAIYCASDMCGNEAGFTTDQYPSLRCHDTSSVAVNVSEAIAQRTCVTATGFLPDADDGSQAAFDPDAVLC